MSGLPLVTLEGNLVADAEVKFTNTGKAVCKLRTASNARRRDEQGNWVDGETCYLTVTLFGPTAEAAAELRKGTPVLVTGRLSQRQWEQDGVRRNDYELKADSLAVVVRRAKSAEQSGGSWGPQGEEPPF